MHASSLISYSVHQIRVSVQATFFKKKQFLDEEFSLKERKILLSNPHPKSVNEENSDPT